MFWGLISQVQVLKVEVPCVGLEPFTPLGKLPLNNFLFLNMLGSLYWEDKVSFMAILCPNQSYKFLCGFLLICLICSHNSDRFWIIFSEEITIYVAVDSVYPLNKLSSVSSYTTPLRWNRLFLPKTIEYIFFSSVLWTFSRIDSILGHKTSLNKPKWRKRRKYSNSMGTLTPHLHQWIDHPDRKLIRKHRPWMSH